MIKTVDYLVSLIGNGVPSNQGAIPLRNFNGKILKNHILPKLRGFKYTQDFEKDGETKTLPANITDVDLKKTPPYISETSFKYVLFEKDTVDLPPSPPSKGDLKSHLEDNTDAISTDITELILPSLKGLLGGYLYPTKKSVSKRDKALYMGESKLIKGEGNFEQFRVTKASRVKKEADEASDPSMFSKHTLGDTAWEVPLSISIKNLRCIKVEALGKDIVTLAGLKIYAEKMKAYLSNLNKTLKLNKTPDVDYGEFFNEGSSFKIYPEVGLYLNDDAIDIILVEFEKRLSDLYSRKSEGFYFCESFKKDYNDTIRSFRIARCSGDYTACNLDKGILTYQKYWVKKQDA